MKKNKVLFVIHQLNHGGVQKSLLTALNAVDYEKYDVTLYIRKNRVQLRNEVNENVKQIIINDDKTHYYRKPYMIWLLACKGLLHAVGNKPKEQHIQDKIAAYLNQCQMEYEKKMHFHSNEQYDVAVSYIQGYNAKFVADYVNAKRKVMFFHGSTDETHSVHQEIMEKYNQVVGVNEEIQNLLEDWYPAYSTKMTFLENYVDAAEVRAKAKAFSIEKPKDKLILSSCGRLTPVKGFDLAVQAAIRMKENGINFLWYFIGDGSERSNLEKLIVENGLVEHIQITGMQENPYPYIDACDIYVQPSYEEAQPLSIIEAFILCKPVVSTATVGGNALIKNGQNGIIVDIDAQSIADSIEYLFNNHAMQQMFTNNLKEIDYAKQKDMYEQQWKQLLEG